jgi:hypothetical protein
MKASLLIGGAVGYVLGTRAGRERYEDLVALARKVAGSAPAQSASGALRSRTTHLASRGAHRVAAQIPGVRTISNRRLASANGTAAGNNGVNSKGWTSAR